MDLQTTFEEAHTQHLRKALPLQVDIDPDNLVDQLFLALHKAKDDAHARALIAEAFELQYQRNTK